MGGPEGSVLGLGLLSMEACFPFRRMPELLTQGRQADGWGRNPGSRAGAAGRELTCFPPRGLAGRRGDGGRRPRPADRRAAGGPTLARIGWGPLGGPEDAKEPENKLGERSGLGAGGGAASGGGESERQPERGGPRKRRAPPTHPGRERRRGQRQAGPGGCRALDPQRDPAAPSPPAR